MAFNHLRIPVIVVHVGVGVVSFTSDSVNHCGSALKNTSSEVVRVLRLTEAILHIPEVSHLGLVPFRYLAIEVFLEEPNHCGIVRIQLSPSSDQPSLRDHWYSWNLASSIVPDVTLHWDLVLDCCPHIISRLQVKKSEVNVKENFVPLMVNDPETILILN